MTTTVNYGFGAGVLSPSTGIVLNNEMGDFSAPTELTPDMLPPAPANFIEPNKRPLSSMTPIIITKVWLYINILLSIKSQKLMHLSGNSFDLSGLESDVSSLISKILPNFLIYCKFTLVNSTGRSASWGHGW